MILRLILAIVWWVWLGYWIAHLRYWNTESINILKNDHKTLLHDHELLQDHYTQLNASQELIKAKAKELVAQNEDYAKIISQLNRYYYKLQDVRDSIEEISDMLGPQDTTFEKKLENMEQYSSLKASAFKEPSNKDSDSSKLQR